MPGLDFLEVPGYPSYKVGVCGTVIGPSGKPLRPIKHRNGYTVVTLYRDGRPKIISVHRLVLLVHEGPCPINHTAGHRNGVRHDNRLENLYWASKQDQITDLITHGTLARGSKVGTAKLDEATVASIKQQLTSSERIYGSKWTTRIAHEFGVSKACIEAIDRGLRWRHV